MTIIIIENHPKYVLVLIELISYQTHLSYITIHLEYALSIYGWAFYARLPYLVIGMRYHGQNIHYLCALDERALGFRQKYFLIQHGGPNLFHLVENYHEDELRKRNTQMTVKIPTRIVANYAVL